MNVNKKLLAMPMPCPAGLTSNGKISLGTIHVRGPHDHPNPAEIIHIRTSTRMADPFEKLDVPAVPSSAENIYAKTNCTTYIITQLIKYISIKVRGKSKIYNQNFLFIMNDTTRDLSLNEMTNEIYA